MARGLALFRYQLTDYWRRAFAIRGGYDAGSGLILLILFACAFRFVTILRETATAIANGRADGLIVLLTIVFLSWMLPALESQRFSSTGEKLGHLPVKRTKVALINLAAIFLLPMSVVAGTLSVAAIYPFLSSHDPVAGVGSLAIFIAFSALANSAIVNLFRGGFSRSVLLLCIGGSAAVLAGGWFWNRLLLIARLAGDSFVAPSVLSAAALVAVFVGAFTLALISSLRLTSERVTPRGNMPLALFSKIKIPLKYGELIKKDLFYYWRTVDFSIAAIVTILYAVLLLAGDFSFQSYGPAISLIVMLMSSFAFNMFGVESPSAVERLSLVPIKPAYMLATKHKTFALVVLSAIIFLFPLVIYKFGPVSLFIAVVKTGSLILLYTAWGNHLSIKYPFPMRHFQVSLEGSWGRMIYGISAISGAIIAPELWAPDVPSQQLAINLILLILSWALYVTSLNRNARRLSQGWSTIALRLS